MFRRRERYEPGSLIVRSDRELRLTAPIWNNAWERFWTRFLPPIRQPRYSNAENIYTVVVLDPRRVKGLVYFGRYVPGSDRSHNPDIAVSPPASGTDEPVAQCSPLEFAIENINNEFWMFYWFGAQPARLEQPGAAANQLPRLAQFVPNLTKSPSREYMNGLIASDAVPQFRLYDDYRLFVPDKPESAGPLRFDFSLIM
jgi:hypothetical protein